MTSVNGQSLGRRELLTRAAPACAITCLGLSGMPTILGEGIAAETQEQHKFDVRRQINVSRKERWHMNWDKFIDLVRTLRTQMGDEELIPFLNMYSEAWGRRLGEGQAERFSNTRFGTFVNQFRPPRYAEALTHEVVEDTDTVFELRVTECINATCFREEGLGGDIGHACVCNMDYAWPMAFNPRMRMERTKTLMRGDDCCNHRYLVAD